MLFDKFFNRNTSKPDSRTPWNPSNIEPYTRGADLRGGMPRAGGGERAHRRLAQQVRHGVLRAPFPA